MLGLALSPTLGQTKTPALLQQLIANDVIDKHIWSLMLINGAEGLLSIGGTGAEAVTWVKKQTEADLQRARQLEQAEVKEGETQGGPLVQRKVVENTHAAPSLNWEDEWRWSKVQAAEGWWQILMQGVWVDGSRALKNQPVIIDFNTPFTLAPPAAANAFYSSISGARRMAAPYSRFYSFPCLNPPKVAFEFGGWQFPVMQGDRDIHEWGALGGRFSLGRMREGSGYCVGAVVETRMGEGAMTGGGLRHGRDARRGGSTAAAASIVDAGNGLKDVWVLGEGFFRGASGVFDVSSPLRMTL